MKVKSKLTLMLALLLLATIESGAQYNEIKQLLDQISKAVNSISAGQFRLHDNYYKISIGEDTSKRNRSYNCLFQKLPSDTLIGYQLASFREDGYEKVYDGIAFMTLTPWNKTLEITEKTKYPLKIKKLKEDYFIFPFFKYLNTSLQRFNNDTLLNRVNVLGVETYNGEECYKVQAGISQNTDKYKSEAYIFVSTASYLPVGQYVRLETTVGQAKEIQIFNYWISDFKAGLVSQEHFSKAALSTYSKEKLFDPTEDASKSKLLPIGAQAPNWQLPLVLGTSLSLSDLKGKIVILDFWYKACAPCQKQMIALQRLHEKYDRDSVVFIGVNTIDDPVKDKLKLFLSKRNITMMSVYNGKSIENSYGIYASPALFVIDKEGKIVFTVDGYSETLLEDLSKIIQKHL